MSLPLESSVQTLALSGNAWRRPANRYRTELRSGSGRVITLRINNKEFDLLAF